MTLSTTDSVATERPRYVTGIWTHLFEEDGRTVERECRIAFDLEARSMTAMSVKRGHRWHSATNDERADLTDSLVNANPEALDDPEGWDLETAEKLPDWAE